MGIHTSCMGSPAPILLYADAPLCLALANSSRLRMVLVVSIIYSVGTSINDRIAYGSCKILFLLN